MKSIILTALLVFSASAQAELKPEGSIVTTECGINSLNGMSNTEYPESVCVGQINDRGMITKPVVIIKKGEDTEYLLVVAKFDKSATVKQWQAYPIDVEERGGYLFMVDIRLVGEPVFLSYVGGVTGTSLDGPLFQVNLRPVPVTKSN